MTQKGNLFKGQQKKPQSANHHGKPLKTRKGKTFKKPSKLTKADEISHEVTKFINQANEVKAATLAAKEGTQFKILKAPPEATSSKKK